MEAVVLSMCCRHMGATFESTLHSSTAAVHVQVEALLLLCHDITVI